jgi:hypothetical protein
LRNFHPLVKKIFPENGCIVNVQMGQSAGIQRTPGKREWPPWLHQLLLHCQANVELWSVAMALQLSEQHHAGLGFRHTKLSFEPAAIDSQSELQTLIFNW